MPEPTPTPIVITVGEGAIWNVLGEKITCKVTSDQTHGAYAIVEELTPSQGSTPLHLHRSTDEIFYVLEGEYEVICGDRTFNAPKGTVFVAPRTISHRLRNTSAAISRVLVTLIPGGFEKFFAEANDITEVPKVLEIAKRHDVEILPPQD
jgi:uncharacterized cupin superfamily protein